MEYIRNQSIVCGCISLICIWLLGALIAVYNAVLSEAKVHAALVRGLIPARMHTKDLADDVAGVFCVGINHVEFAEGHALLIAELTGLFRPKVCIPIASYSDEMLKHIIAHELMHYYYKDRWFRLIAIFTAVVFWLNPIPRIMLREIEKWDEIHCDASVCKQYNKREYALTLCAIAEEAVAVQERCEILDSSWLRSCFLEEKYTENEERIEFIMKSNKKQKKVAALLAAMLMVVFVCGTAMGADEVTSLGSRADMSTVRGNESEGIFGDNTLEEQTMQLTDEMLEEWGIVLNPQISTYASSNATIDIDLTNNIWNSGAFWASNGKSIHISISLVPNNVNVKAGIIDPAGTFRYVSGSNAIVHTFSLTQGGFYNVVVWNETTTSIHAFGAYITY